MKKLAALALCAAMTVSMTNTVFAQKEVKSIADLEGAKIGVQLGTTGDIYASDYEGDKAGTEVVRYNKANETVMALKQGKIDCVIIDSLPAEKLSKETMILRSSMRSLLLRNMQLQLKKATQSW